MSPPARRSVGTTLQSPGPRVADDAMGHEIAALAPWFHNLHLPSGHDTAPDHPLGDFPSFKWDQVAPSLPADLSGWKVLDIGCNAGFYSFALAARGADVLGIDHDDHYLDQARWAAQHLDPHARTSFRQMGIYDLDDLEDSFDLVLFLGVLYHLRYPLLAIDILAEKVRRLLLIQTMTMPQAGPAVVAPPDLPIDERHRLTEPGWPQMAFIERRVAGDETNWWAPNEACVEAMLRSAGFEISGRPAHEFFLCEPGGGLSSRDELRAATGSQTHKETR